MQLCEKLQCAEYNIMFICVLNVQENVTDVFFPLFHPYLFQWHSSRLTIFFRNMHVLYLFVYDKSTTFIGLLWVCKKVNGPC